MTHGTPNQSLSILLVTVTLFGHVRGFAPRYAWQIRTFAPQHRREPRLPPTNPVYVRLGVNNDTSEDIPATVESPEGTNLRDKIPMWLTFSRCFMIPVLVYVFYRPLSHVLAPVIFSVAALTDWLDGYLARRWNVESSFGAFLDPVVSLKRRFHHCHSPLVRKADKLMVSTALILLSGRYGSIVAVPTAVILAREISVSALREWMACNNLRQVVKVGFQGKVKTALTMVALTIFLAVNDEVGKLFPVALAFTYASTVITVTSGSVYFKAAAPYLKSPSRRIDG